MNSLQSSVYLLIAILVAFVVRRLDLRIRRRRARIGQTNAEADAGCEEVDAESVTSRLYRDIEPLPSFDWCKAEPIQNATFKDIYHLTMALQNCTFPELVEMDKTYHDKIMLRRQIIRDHSESVMACNPIASDAVFELYEWMFGTYLPKRFPSMFTIVPTEKGIMVCNAVTSEDIPLIPPPETPEECLRILGSHVDDEFLILLPNANPLERHPPKITPTPNPTMPYYLHALILCFPSGFNTPKKLGLPLSAIHQPVPGYAQKLEKSMDRFFASLPFGKIVKRTNWACQQDDTWFKLSGNHGHVDLKPGFMAPPTHDPSEEDIQQWKKEAEKVVPEKCRLRSERQTLHRLEKTGALVFAFKTYMYPLEEIKKAGLGPTMAAATEGMWKGSVPAMAVYKRGVVWARKVVAYLRDEQ